MRQVRCQFNCKLEGSRTQIGFGNVPDFWCERPTVSGMTNIYSVLGRAHPARYSKARSPESMNRNANFKISQYATTTGKGGDGSGVDGGRMALEEPAKCATGDINLSAIHP